MKLLYSIFLVLTISTLSYGQNEFSDNFDSYTAGAFLGTSSTSWSTWSNAPGGSEDVKISAEKAHSGANSIKFSSTASGGGPTDVILKFGGKRTTGFFTYTNYMLVPSGKKGYFNFQGNTTPGQIWSLNTYIENGTVLITNSANGLITSGACPMDTWFKLSFEINLTYNSWKVLVDDVCIGVFKNNNNFISSIDLYPADNLNLFYVDDVSYTYTATAPSVPNDLGVSISSWDGKQLTGSTGTLIYTLNNLGSSVVNDAQLKITYGGQTQTKDLTNLGLGVGGSKTLTLDNIVLVSGNNEFTFEIVSVNGQADDEPCNNQITRYVTASTAAEHRAVIAEEATGTWCQWCPRGAVFMDLMSTLYDGYFIPIAVHNNDPMEVTNYDAYIATLPDFSGYPSASVNRTSMIDPSNINAPFLSQITTAPVAKFTTGAKYDATTSKVDVSVDVDFLQNATGTYWFNLVLTEDGVRGTVAGYNQSNAYANNAAGPMGGFESKPNPVPAAQMVYDHVARILLGEDKSNSITGTFAAGDRKTVVFSFNVPAGVNLDSCYLIPIMMSNAGYENAKQNTFNEAIAHGFTNAENVILTSSHAKFYPNPATEVVFLDINLEKSSDINVAIRDVSGKVVKTQQFNGIQVGTKLPVNITGLNTGVYFATVSTNQGARIEKIVVR